MRMDQGKLLKKPAGYAVLGTMGFLFFFCCLTGRDLAAEGNILWTGAYLVRTLGLSLAAGAALGGLVCVLFYRMAGSGGAALEAGAASGKRWGGWLWARASGRSPGRKALGGLVVLFLAWLPGFLAYYPAICAYDMPIQTGQLMAGIYIDHHPIAHTLLLKGAVLLGENVFGNINAGIGCYALVQMAFLASSFAFGIWCLCRRRTRRIWLVLVALSGMLYPFHHYMSISVTKDTIFTAFFFLQVMSLLELILGQEEWGEFPRGRLWGIYFFSTVGMS